MCDTFTFTMQKDCYKTNPESLISVVIASVPIRCQKFSTLDRDGSWNSQNTESSIPQQLQGSWNTEQTLSAIKGPSYQILKRNNGMHHIIKITIHGHSLTHTVMVHHYDANDRTWPIARFSKLHQMRAPPEFSQYA